jgi:hypothetical protein
MATVCRYFKGFHSKLLKSTITYPFLSFQGYIYRNRHCCRNTRASIRYSSTSSSPSPNGNGTGSGNPQAQLSRQKQRLESRFYEVCELDYSGTIRCSTLHISDILKGSTMHARDFFSLQLTNYDQKIITKNQQKVAPHDVFSTSEAVRLRRRPSPAILPRGKKILVCFGHIRAVIAKDHGMIFETHDPLVQVSFFFN